MFYRAVTATVEPGAALTEAQATALISGFIRDAKSAGLHKSSRVKRMSTGTDVTTVDTGLDARDMPGSLVISMFWSQSRSVLVTRLDQGHAVYIDHRSPAEFKTYTAGLLRDLGEYREALAAFERRSQELLSKHGLTTYTEIR